ncbi:unnamed protein product [Periconia digitata]|uniref:Heterokaryon incompatibility domain-containing protein n=1 Tax=Periconia digitata TaxID=1303443 RepID=A0A9W4UE67_9PLEO|nr:unnamed protein product [Periconia digitata]
MLSKDQIRLISLHPASADVAATAPIECDIEIVELSAKPEYEAVTYVWGTESASASVELAGRTVPISPTLHNALLRFRRPDRKRTLWIDQLCIKQDDLDEKMQQVRLMRTIYSSCTQCVVWMGEMRQNLTLADADAAFQFLRCMGEVAQTGNQNIDLPAVIRDNMDGMNRALMSVGSQENQWWNRVWTVQEACLPKHRTIQWGPLTLPWTILDAASWTWTSTVWGHDTLPRETFEALGHIMVHTIWLRHSREGSDSIFHEIHKWRFRQAKNSLDKVYGLLGICEPGRLPLTERCDYSVSPAHMFATLTREMILDHGGLQPLTPYPRQDRSVTTPDNPSWAVDLRSTALKDAPDMYYQIHGYYFYDANKHLGAIDLDRIRSEMGQDVLTLDGVCVGTIERVEPGYRPSRNREDNFPNTEALLPAWYRTAMLVEGRRELSESTMYPGGGGRYTRKEAFLRLVLGDVMRNREQDFERDVSGPDLDDVEKMMEQKGAHVPYETRFTAYGMMANQNLFMTSNGLMGIGHIDVRAGDEVWIFKGGKVPFAIRPQAVEAGSGYSFLGHCYVQGVMRGEVGAGIVPKVDLVERTVCLW